MQNSRMTRSESGRLGAIAKAKSIRESYDKNPKLCKECYKPLAWEHRKEGKFCSSGCAATHNNRGVRRWGKPPRECIGCGKPTRNPSFCSNHCQRDWEWSNTKSEIERDGVFPPSNRIIKRYLLEKYGCKCAICGGIEWQGKPMPLEVDHISGRWDDNAIPNVRLVCGNCGMQLPTYKNKNKGNGRFARRERYAQGKSC
jgi:hypothetical protein